jgi:hypothetical protein
MAITRIVPLGPIQICRWTLLAICNDYYLGRGEKQQYYTQPINSHVRLTHSRAISVCFRTKNRTNRYWEAISSMENLGKSSYDSNSS